MTGTREYPPAHVIHQADCEDAPGGLFVFKAASLQGYPNSRPHRCFSSETVAQNREVVAEPVDYEPHPYSPSTIHPDDAPRPLCEVCRGTHGEQPVDLGAFLGLGAGR